MQQHYYITSYFSSYKERFCCRECSQNVDRTLWFVNEVQRRHLKWLTGSAADSCCVSSSQRSGGNSSRTARRSDPSLLQRASLCSLDISCTTSSTSKGSVLFFCSEAQTQSHIWIFTAAGFPQSHSHKTKPYSHLEWHCIGLVLTKEPQCDFNNSEKNLYKNKLLDQ